MMEKSQSDQNHFKPTFGNPTQKVDNMGPNFTYFNNQMPFSQIQNEH